MLKTPAFILNSNKLQLYQNQLGFDKVYRLFSLKSFNFIGNSLVSNLFINGFSCSSLNELLLAKETIKPYQKIHLTSPGLRQDEYDQFAEIANFITFNSFHQWNTYQSFVNSHQQYGLRINPGYSVLQDKRYDPCKKHSKLGVPMDTLLKTLNTEPEMFKNISGLHFHNNCDSEDFEPLLLTAKHIEKHLGSYLKELKWINMGGGYLFDEPQNFDAFHQTVELFHDKYGLEVFIEPGAGIIRDACSLVSTVIDMFESDGKTIAILDTTVNHLPEVFEYQYHHEIAEESEDGQYAYILAGSTCLAGDEFGLYKFDNPLRIGDQVTFEGVGAYSLVKAHMFNGVNLPSIYSINDRGELELVREYSYQDFVSRLKSNKELEELSATAEGCLIRS